MSNITFCVTLCLWLNIPVMTCLRCFQPNFAAWVQNGDKSFLGVVLKPTSSVPEARFQLVHLLSSSIKQPNSDFYIHGVFITSAKKVMLLELFICLFVIMTLPHRPPRQKLGLLWISVNSSLYPNSMTERNLLAYKSWNKRPPAHCYFDYEWCVCPVVELQPIPGCVPVSPRDA